MSNIKINLIDVGCADYLIKPWVDYSNNINFILGFDVSGTKKYHKQLKLKKIKHKIINKVIFDEERIRELYSCYKLQNSSLFYPNSEIVEKFIIKGLAKNKIERRKKDFTVKENIKVNCVRLDNTIVDLGVDFDFIKIDTQGADFNVLKSLGKFLDTQIIGIEAELFYKELYKGIALFHEVDSFLKEHNFYKFKRFGCQKKKAYCEFLYIREDDAKKEKIKFIKNIYKKFKKG